MSAVSLPAQSVPRRRALVLLAGAVASAAAGQALRPTRHLADQLGPIELEKTIPTAFGPWRIDPHEPASVVNPEVAAMLQSLYSEILSRNYVDTGSGYRIMLSIAYGSDQSESQGLHDPAVCYPAQGFAIERRQRSTLATPAGSIPVRRLQTRLGSGRAEPVTYWMTIGEQIFESGAERKMVQMRYALRGLIPDGLVFRVSSIDRDATAAFEAHEGFVRALVEALPLARRARFLGAAARA